MLRGSAVAEWLRCCCRCEPAGLQRAGRQNLHLLLLLVLSLQAEVRGSCRCVGGRSQSGWHRLQCCCHQPLHQYRPRQWIPLPLSAPTHHHYRCLHYLRSGCP